MRLTNRVFDDLAIWMVVFGLFIGFGFPFFVILLGVPAATALTPIFFGACPGAGALAGGINFALAKLVVGVRVRLLAENMGSIEDHLREMTYSSDLSRCTPENCSIEVDSDDAIGESTRAFNRLVEALAASMQKQAAVRSFSEVLASHLEIRTLSGRALGQLLEFTGAAGGTILVDAGGELEVTASFGLRHPEAIAKSDHARTAMRTGETQVLEMPERVQIDNALASFRPRGILVAPVSYKDVPLAVVALASPAIFDLEARARLDLVRHGLGLALNNAMAHNRLQRLAALDSLTGVYNRCFGMSRLHESSAAPNAPERSSA
jgi:hypothetical protein